MSAQWMLTDKENISKNLSTEITYPFEVSNFSRKKKIVNNKEELFEHLICKKELKDITQILSAKINPEYFIDEISYQAISHFMRFKNYGINFLYKNGYEQIPNCVLQAFDIINAEIQKDEKAKLDTIKENNKNSSSTKKHSKK